MKRTRPAYLRPKVTLPKHATPPDQIERIAALTRNAKATWLSLLGVLLFVGITLLRFEHIDFYGYNRQTQLPLIGVSVPTPFFFYAAPILVAANYIYFHLYLIRLWDALGTAPARIDGVPLGRAVQPWLVTDAALWLRNRLQNDGCADRRPLEGISAILNLSLSWGFGLIIGGLAWWNAAVARDIYMTALADIALTAMIMVALASFGAMWQRMTRKTAPKSARSSTTSALFIGIFLGFSSYYRTQEPLIWIPKQIDTTQVAHPEQVAYPEYYYKEISFWKRFVTLAEIDLEGTEIVKRPADWLPYDLVRADYRKNWCERENKTNCKDLGNDETRFNAEFWARQNSALVYLQRPKWHKPGRDKPDFRGANLRDSFLAGLDLNGARMEAAILTNAQMRGANLSKADMHRADLSKALLNGANLSKANMESARLEGAKIQNAFLTETEMKGADLTDATMYGTDFIDAKMQEVNLTNAQMQWTHLTGANLENANMRGTNLTGATMQDTDLKYSLLVGKSGAIQLGGTSFSKSKNNGGAIRNVDLSTVKSGSAFDWRNVFLDGSVKGQDHLLDSMGLTASPCQWADTVLDDVTFNGRWRGWIEAEPNTDKDKDKWASIAPTNMKDVPSIPPPANCSWTTDPLPGMSASKK